VDYIDGESLRSYISRLATALGVPVGQTLLATGVLREDEKQRIAGFGIDLSDERLRRLCHTTDLSELQARSMLVRRFDQTALDLSTHRLEDPGSYRGFGHHTTLFSNASHACPRCLEDDAAWRLHWRFPWSFCCPRHECLLVARCPGCSQRTHRSRYSSMHAPYHSIIPQPGRCENAPQRGRNGSHRACPCPFDLTSVESPDMSLIVNVQRALHEIVDGAPGAVGGSRVSSLQFLRDLRLVTELVLFGVDAEHMAGIPAPAVQALRDHRVSHEQALRQAPPGRYTNVAPRYEDPALMAALLPVGLEILAEPTGDALADGLVPLLERGGSRGNRRHWDAWRRGSSSQLRRALDIAHTRTSFASFRSRIGIAGPGARVGTPLADLEVRHVPQAFWIEPYRERLADMLPGVSEATGRMVCSVLLVRLIEPGTSWSRAAAELGLGEWRAKWSAGNALKHLTGEGAIDELATRLRVIAREQTKAGAVDYQERRRLFADWGGLSARTWADVCGAVGYRFPTRIGRVNASAWIWTECTGGYFKHCPLLTDVPAADRRLLGDTESLDVPWTMYSRFKRNALAATRTALELVGAVILQDLQAGREASERRLRRALANFDGSMLRHDPKAVLAALAGGLGRTVEDLLSSGACVADRDLALLALREITGRAQTDLCADLNLSWSVVNNGCRRAAQRVREDRVELRRFRDLVAANGGPTRAEIPPAIVRRPRRKATRVHAEVRERAVRLVMQSGRPPAQVAREIGVSAETVRHWVRREKGRLGV
jgi:DNA-directed RNA polymerase specialized sigma24 family protein